MSSTVLSPRGNGKGKRTNPQRQTRPKTYQHYIDRCHIIIYGRTDGMCTLFFYVRRYNVYNNTGGILLYYWIRFILGSVPIYCCCDMKRVCYVIGKQNIDGHDDLWPRYKRRTGNDIIRYEILYKYYPNDEKKKRYLKHVPILPTGVL